MELSRGAAHGPCNGKEVFGTWIHPLLAAPGNHALYIDGTDLYPGFELDEFCAVFIALDSSEGNNDWEFVDDTILKACGTS